MFKIILLFQASFFYAFASSTSVTTLTDATFFNAIQQSAYAHACSGGGIEKRLQA